MLLQTWLSFVRRSFSFSSKCCTGHSRLHKRRETAAATCPEMLEDRTLLSAISWDGGAGTVNWADAANWSGDTLPATGDDVTINAPSSTVRFTGPSLELASLTTTSLTVSNSSLTVLGPLNAVNATLTADGANGTVSATGQTNIDRSTVIVSNGATLSLPNVTSYAQSINNNNRYFRASGAGSVLNLPGITSLTDIGYWLYIQAQSGGRVNLPALATIIDSYVDMSADGNNSMLNLPAFTTFNDTNGAYGYVAATNGASLFLSLSGTSFIGVSMTLQPSATITAGSIEIGVGSLLQGTGALPSDLTNRGEIRVGGAPGSLTVAGDFAQSSTGNLVIEIGGALAGSGYDAVFVSGVASLGGTVSVSRINNYAPFVGQEFAIVQASSVAGSFQQTQGASIGAGIKLISSTTATRAILSANVDSGPRVVSSTVSGQTTGSLTRFDVYFDEPVAAASFTSADVTLSGPHGAVSVISVTPVTNQHFRVDVEDQVALGVYTLTLGPQITDLAGNPMDQNGNDTNGEAGDAFQTQQSIVAGEQSVLIVNVNGSYNGDMVNIYETVLSAGARAKWVNLNASGKATVALQQDNFDQVWLLDLSSGTDAYTSDWNAIATWYAANRGQIIADARIFSSYGSGRWQSEGLKLSQNYYENLKSRQGGLILGTDHDAFQTGINSVNAAIGLNLFSGNFNLPKIPVDTANPLMTTPNNMGSELFDDSTPGLTPFGLQPNGQILYSVAWHTGNFSTPGISSTIQGAVGFSVDIAAPANQATIIEGNTVHFAAQQLNGTPPISYTWSSDRDGVLGTGATLDINHLSLGTHVITLLGTDAVNAADNASITLTISPLPATISLDLQAASDSGASSTDNITNLKQLTFDITVNKPGVITLDVDGDGTPEITRNANAAGVYALQTSSLADAAYHVIAKFTPDVGSVVQATLTAVVDTIGPRMLSGSTTEQAATASRTVLFNEAIVSLTAAAGVVSDFTGPGGNIPITSVTGSGATWNIGFAYQTQAGQYVYTASATIRDIAGNLIDQDQDGTAGETSDDRAVDQFQLLADVTAPLVA